MSLFPEPLQQVDRTFVWQRGRKLSYFAGCDYFRLASHPRVLDALKQGLYDYGLNVAASRMTTGNHRIYETLETALSKFFGFEAALLVSNGYLTNLAAAQGLTGQFGPALLDERAHASVRDAAALLGSKVRTFRHLDTTDLARQLPKPSARQPVLVMTDGVFSHDGSLAPLAEYRKRLPSSAWLWIDDAHGAGVLGAHGRGTLEHWGLGHERTILCVTLSKAFGVYGGAVLATRKVIDRIRDHSRLVTGNTPLPPPLAAAALASLKTLRENPDLRERLHANVHRVKTALQTAGHPVTDTPSPIVSLNPKSATEATRLRRRLLQRQVFPSFIRYPGGPQHGYFRFAISSEHTTGQLDALIAALT